jgi:hypothetical protein
MKRIVLALILLLSPVSASALDFSGAIYKQTPCFSVRTKRAFNWEFSDTGGSFAQIIVYQKTCGSYRRTKILDFRRNVESGDFAGRFRVSGNGRYRLVVLSTGTWNIYD